MVDESSERKPRPPWLIGLMIAVVVFIILVVVAKLAGYGDDPAVGASQAVRVIMNS